MEDTRKLGLAEGDVLVSSWGYDQTNVDFYKVLVPAEAGKYCTLVKVGQKYVSGDAWSGTVVAVPEQVMGAPFKKRVKPATSYSGPSVKIASYAYASPWDGRPKSQTGYA